MRQSRDAARCRPRRRADRGRAGHRGWGAPPGASSRELGGAHRLPKREVQVRANPALLDRSGGILSPRRLVEDRRLAGGVERRSRIRAQGDRGEGSLRGPWSSEAVRGCVQRAGSHPQHDGVIVALDGVLDQQRLTAQEDARRRGSHSAHKRRWDLCQRLPREGGAEGRGQVAQAIFAQPDAADGVPRERRAGLGDVGRREQQAVADEGDLAADHRSRVLTDRPRDRDDAQREHRGAGRLEHLDECRERPRRPRRLGAPGRRRRAVATPGAAREHHQRQGREHPDSVVSARRVAHAFAPQS